MKSFIFVVSLLSNLVEGVIHDKVYLAVLEFGKISRTLSNSKTIALSIGSIEMGMNFNITVRKSEPVLSPDYNNRNESERRLFVDLDKHLYVGNVTIYNNRTATSVPIVLELKDYKIDAIFCDQNNDYHILPGNHNTTYYGNRVRRSEQSGTNIHTIRIKSNPKESLWLRAVPYFINDGNDKSINGSRFPKKRDGNVHYIIETTLHIPSYKITTQTRYFLYIISEVNQILKYPYMTADVRIQIADILEYTDEAIYPNNIERTYYRFSEYKEDQYFEIDLSILISNQIIEYLPNGQSVTGMSGLGYMCIPFISILLAQDEGFMTTNTIVHELGHLLGSKHDMNSTCDEAGEMGVMHYKSRGIQRKRWSHCSANRIENFLESSVAECLLEKNDVIQLSKLVDLPGFDLYDQQCSVSLKNESAFVISNRSDCRRIVCRLGEREAMLYDAPMEGTPCHYSLVTNITTLTPIKHGKLCFQGLCLTKEAIAGTLGLGWGPWGQWSECLQFGFKIRNRTCTSTQKTFCQGDARMAHKCEII